MTIPLEFTCLDAQSASYDNVLTLTADHVICGVNANPVAVWFEVTSVAGAAATGPGAGTRDPQFHDILYQWDFGDPNNAAPTTPLNMPDAWKDTNTGFGREACHVYNDGGTHSVTVYAYEPATRRFGSLTFDVAIEYADTAFAAGNTIIFNPGNAVNTSAFDSANVITTSWADVVAARNSKGLTNCRILIAPGVTLTDTQLAAPDNWSNIRIGAMDPASKPVIEVNALSDPLVRDWDFDNRELVLYDLDFRGPWDSTSETGRIHLPMNSRKGEGFTGNFLTLYHRCKFDGFDSVQSCYQTGSAQNTYNICNDTEITNWQNYGIFGGFVQNGATSRPKTAVIGCSLHQHEDALSGGPKNGMYNNHGPLRDSESAYLYISASDLFTRNGWSAGGTDAAGYAVTSDQPAIRVNTKGAEDYHSYMDRVAAEGTFGFEEQGSTQTDVPGNHVMDKVLQVLGSRQNASEGIELRYSGTTLRNLLTVKLNLPEATNLTFKNAVFASNSNGAANNDEEIAIYNATLLDLRSDANARSEAIALYRGPTEVFGSGTDFSTVTLENNVFVQPNRTGVNTDDAPLDVTTPIPGFTPRHKGPRWNFQHYEMNLTALVSGSGGTLDIPYSQIKDTRANIGGLDNGVATSQAYWQAIEGIDTLHRVRINGNNNTTFYADLGQIAVTFGALAITITNTSGVDWNTGDNLRLRLDRTSLLAPFDPQFDSQGQIVPLAKPQEGSQALGTGGAGTRAYDDLLLRTRPNTGGERGALLCT